MSQCLYFQYSLYYKLDIKESPFILNANLKRTNEKIFSIDVKNFTFILTKTLLHFTVFVPFHQSIFLDLLNALLNLCYEKEFTHFTIDIIME